MDIFLQKGILEEYQQEYVSSLFDKIEQLEVIIVNDQVENLDLFKRIVHSIKGSAGSYELDFASLVAQKLEDFLEHASFCPVTQNSPYEGMLPFIDLWKEYLGSFNITATTRPSYRSLKETLFTISQKAEQKDHKVLIVDSAKSIRLLLAQTLMKLGLHVSQVGDPVEAIQRLLVEDFDSIITSQRLDKMKGNSLLGVIQNLPEIEHKPLSILITSDESIYGGPQFVADEVIKKDQFLSKKLTDLFQRLIINKKLGSPLESDEEKRKKLDIQSILVVDDDPDIHSLLKKAFEKEENLKVVYTSKKTEMLKLLQVRTFDLVLLDYYLEEETGDRLLKEWKSAHYYKKTPVIFLTASQKTEELEYIRQAGAKGILNKPFKPKGLFHDILKLLG